MTSSFEPAAQAVSNADRATLAARLAARLEEEPGLLHTNDTGGRSLLDFACRAATEDAALPARPNNTR